MVKYVREKLSACDMDIESIRYFKKNEDAKVNASERTMKTRTKKMTTGFLDSEVINDLDERKLM